MNCLDEIRSVFRRPESNPTVIVAVEKLVIDETRVRGRVLFRMTEYPVHVIVDEAFAGEMLEAGIDGFRLLPLPGESR